MIFVVAEARNRACRHPKGKRVYRGKLVVFALLPGLVVAAGCGDGHREDSENGLGAHRIGDMQLEATVSLDPGWDPVVAGTTLCRRAVGRYWEVRFEGKTDSGDSLLSMLPPVFESVSNARLYRLAARLREDPWVTSVTPVYSDLEGLPPLGSEGMLPIDDPEWHLGPLGINAGEAWDLFARKGREPGQGILIGLTDTGYLEHPELYFQDGSSQIRFDLQRNFVELDRPDDAQDGCTFLCALEMFGFFRLRSLGHGSITAGLMISPAGRQTETLGRFGARGAVPGARVIPVRVSTHTVLNEATMNSLATGIRYAVDNGATVISISLGGVANDDLALHETIRDVVSEGVIVVAAAGNMPVGRELPYQMVAKPASYEETIAVGGATADQAYWRETNRGPEVDISAPAQDIRIVRTGMVSQTTWVFDTGLGIGSSLATALTASVAALWQSYHGYDQLRAHYGNDPSKIPEAFRHILHTQGFRRPEDWDTTLFGVGIIDAARVLQAPLPAL